MLRRTLAAGAALLLFRPAAAELSDYAWLAGCWLLETGDDTSLRTEEHWMAPAGGLMLGMSRTLRHGEAVAWEFVRIVEDYYGTRFVASPSGQATVEFFLVSVENDTLVFENTEHDFPQRIVYRKGGAKRLVAWVEGVTAEGRQQRIDFGYERKHCGE